MPQVSIVPSVLPKEIVAAIHHIELNKAGWWEKAVQRLVLASIWLADEPLAKERILETLESEFRLKLSPQRLTRVLDSLDDSDSLLTLTDGRYRIPDSRRKEFEIELTESDEAEKRAKRYFEGLLDSRQIKIDLANAWKLFSENFLSPLISDVGANAYRLVTGESTIDGGKILEKFLHQFPAGERQQLAEVTQLFLSPQSNEARSHISRLLHARLCVEASGLPEETVNKIRDVTGKAVKFRIFVDTNFLFSLMELHENPSNATARELQELIDHLRENLTIELFVTPKTVDEAKRAIRAAKSRLDGIPSSFNFTTAAMRVGLSGMAHKYLEERNKSGTCLNPDEWFQPYIDDFVGIARAKGIELYNERLDALSLEQSVIDDIHQVMEFEKTMHEDRRKSYDRVEHDMVLWHFVRSKRPAYVESPIDAREWILTVDYRFIGFDQHKMRQSSTSTPLCLHPASLVQLLQFWVPRTKEFEEAILGSLRMPFLFQEFDVEAERTTLKILRGLGRFEGSSDFPVDTISSVIMNDGLRSRLLVEQENDQEVILIRDALVTETQRRIDEERAKTEELAKSVKIKEEAIADYVRRHDEKETEIGNLKVELNQLRVTASQSEARYEEQASKFEKLQQQQAHALAEFRDSQNAKIAELHNKQARRDAMWLYLLLFAFLLILCLAFGWFMQFVIPIVPTVIGNYASIASFAILSFIAGHLLLEIIFRNKPAIHGLWPFVQAKRFRMWLWTLVVTGFMLGVIGNLYANRLQKNLDQLDDSKMNSLQEK